MTAKAITEQSGFTLIETMMAMAIFTIGILGVYGMQTAAIKENLAANTITTGATLAADQVEKIINTDYTDLLNLDASNTSCSGLDEKTPTTADDSISYTGSLPVYNVYWNVARNCLLSNIPDADTTLEQKPLTVRIIVTKTKGNGEEVEAAVFNYIKQNSAKD